MTIEQVDSMTRYADGTHAEDVHPYVWVAPQNLILHRHD